MKDPIPGGSLHYVLLPQKFGRHQTAVTEFTVLSVEIWSTGIVVNMQLPPANGSQPPQPRIAVQDHFGTEYSLESSASIGSRHLQVFTPSVPTGTRSLTITSRDDDGARFVVALAVPAGNFRGGRLKVGHIHLAGLPNLPSPEPGQRDMQQGPDLTEHREAG